MKKNKDEIDKIYFKHVAEQSDYDDVLKETKNAIHGALQKAVDAAGVSFCVSKRLDALQ